MQFPHTFKSPSGLLPTAGLLLFVVTFAWLALYCFQMQTVQEAGGMVESDPTTYWVLLGAAGLAIVMFFGWAAAFSRPRASTVIVRGPRPLLESEIQRLALKQLMRIESRL